MLYLYYIFFYINIVYSEKFIKNINTISCKNCIYYKPLIYNDLLSDNNECTKFGTKNIISNDIKYDSVYTCRNDETKCGKDGIYFIEDKNIKLKFLLYTLYKYFPYFLIIFPYFLLEYINLKDKI
jgi:hypothetical protein